MVIVKPAYYAFHLFGGAMQVIETLYAAHHARLCVLFDQALARAQCDCVLIASGIERYQLFDDRPYPFVANPYFKYWLPLTEHPNCWIVYRSGEKPKLVYYQPADYWHSAPEAPAGCWTTHFDIHIVSDSQQIAALLPPRNAHMAVLGENNAGIAGYEPNNPQAMLAYLDFHRGIKSEYELAMMRQAQLCAVRGHCAAEAAFRAGGSEYEIHHAYIQASGHSERQLPYTSIVCLNAHAAILHYQHQQLAKPLQHLSFLIDAGASHAGYAADITRTYAMHSGLFADMIEAMEQAQLRLCDLARAGNSNSDIHLASHLEIAKILAQFKLVAMSPESMVESGLSRVFYPHGIGHFLGLQVHDVGGFFKDDTGTLEPKPDAHRYLRLTRRFAGDEVLTIEPGLYFIDMLLQEAAQGPHAAALDWTRIDALKHYGGIRIEDNVRVRESGAPENLTRAAFAAIARSETPDTAHA
jgi:Xaa-Pro dipeptidase